MYLSPKGLPGASVNAVGVCFVLKLATKALCFAAAGTVLSGSGAVCLVLLG